MMNYKIDYSELKYKRVNASTTDSSGGTTIPNNEKISIARFRANGADPKCFISLYWDYGGANEKCLSSTRGDIDLYFDVSNSEYQFTGNGSKKIQIIIFNEDSSQSPVVGGSCEVIKI